MDQDHVIENRVPSRSETALRLAVFGLEMVMLSASFYGFLSFVYGCWWQCGGELSRISAGMLLAPAGCALLAGAAGVLYFRINVPRPL